jgi:3-oxoacyl-[acyl-carrier-protein] synthase II
MGAVTPLGVGARVLYDRWMAGQSGIESGIGAATEFDPRDVMSGKEVRRSDRFTQLAVAATQEALEDAGWGDEPPIDPDRIGCVIGTGIGGMGTFETQHDVLRESGAAKVSPLAVPLMMPNAGAGAVSMRYGLRGPAHGTVSACAAGADAIGDAVRLIRGGDADAVVAGGAECALTPLSTAAFGAMGAISESGISRPFDLRRDGFVMGEGSGIFVLERLDVAEARGARVLGEVAGYGASSDAHHLTAPEPGGRGAVRAMLRALEDAGLGPEDVDYINAHGTSTPLNDRSETEAIKHAFGPEAARLAVSSTKSAIGHTLGAAGAVEAVATVLALRDRMAPPTLNYEEPDEGLDLDYVPNQPKPLRARQNGSGPVPAVALSNSFGFGGHNAVLCLVVP